MCTTCGCSGGAHATLTDSATGNRRDLRELELGSFVFRPVPHDHHHAHHHHYLAEGHQADEIANPAVQPQRTTLTLEQDVLAKNNRLAERNRDWLEGRRILALNLMSSPGAGKTTLLERTIRDLQGSLPISVVEGDQETLFDAERIRATGCKSVQINTGTGCHLEADMLAQALKQLDPPPDSLVMIENVGNLVCPALFDLGEQAKVVILSVTEGADKPLKYPHMFRAASLMILNKTDLLPYVDFDVDSCIDFARRINPDMEVLQLSATTGEGMREWYDWLRACMVAVDRQRITPSTEVSGASADFVVVP